MKNVPDKIYLQVGDEIDVSVDKDIDFKELGEVSWCSDKIYQNDIEYLRSGVNGVLPSEEKLIDLYLEKTGCGMDMWGKQESEAITTLMNILYGRK